MQSKKSKDPVCGCQVDEARAQKTTHNNKQYCFCGKDCMDTFKKNPQKYAR